MNNRNLTVPQLSKRNLSPEMLFASSAQANGCSILVEKNGNVKFTEQDGTASRFEGFSSAVGVAATQDNLFFILAENGEIYVFGDNSDGRLEERTAQELYRSEDEPFAYSWDPYFEHPEIIYETTPNGRRPLRYWSAQDSENFMREKFFDKYFQLNNREMYCSYIEACEKYGEKNVETDIVFDVDFNTAVYRNGDYYRQDFKGLRHYVIRRTNSFIYKPVKLQ